MLELSFLGYKRFDQHLYHHTRMVRVELMQLRYKV